MTARFGEAPRNGQRYIARPGVYAILPRDGAYLVTHQSQPFSEIQLPGGGIDPGENPLTALHREIFEETGWHVDRPRRLGAFRRFTWMPEYDIWAEKICTIYVARPTLCLGEPSEPYHQAVWIDSMDILGQLGNQGDASFLKRYQMFGR